jgi:DNA-binding NtrC family response regulator
MGKILVVDDEPGIRRFLIDLFSGNHQCDTADRAEQAFEYLEVEKYDAIITDVSMPGLGGIAVLKRIKERHPETPVIVISGRVSEEDAKTIAEMGAFAFFAKPFNLDEVQDALVRAIAHRQRLRETPRNVPH